MKKLCLLGAVLLVCTSIFAAGTMGQCNSKEANAKCKVEKQCCCCSSSCTTSNCTTTTTDCAIKK